MTAACSPHQALVAHPDGRESAAPPPVEHPACAPGRTAALAGLLLALAATHAAAQIWTHMQIPGPRPATRQGHAAAYAPSTNRMVIFAGSLSGCSSNPATSLNDVWALSSANGSGGPPAWTRVFPGGSPPAGRYGHSGVYDPGSDRMIVFGGRTLCVGSGQNLDDLWVLTDVSGAGGGAGWIALQPIGGPPPGRWRHSAVYDPASNRMVVFGGRWGHVGHDDLWILTHANGLGGTPQWIPVAALGPPPGPRLGHTAVYDPGTNRMIVYGGISRNDVWVLLNANGLGGPPEWVPLPVHGGPVAGGTWDGRSAIYDPGSNRMTIWGGNEPGRACAGALWVLEHANGTGGAPRWFELHPPVPPAGRFPAGFFVPARVDPNTLRMMLFGASWSSPFGCIVVGGNTWVLSDAFGELPIEVAIDIEPGSDPNAVNPRSKGLLPVAILTTSTADGDPLDFDAWDVDPWTVGFGPGAAPLAHSAPHAEDVDGDGDLDMLVHFKTQETGIDCGDTEAALTGETLGGEAIAGTDTLKTAGCKE